MGKSIGKIFIGDKSISTDTRPKAESPEIKKAREIEAQTSSMPIQEKILTGQPQRVKVEQNIANRPDALKILQEEIAYKPDLKGDGIKEAIKIGTTTMKGLGVVDERLNSAIAGPMLEMINPFRKDAMQDTALAIINGVTGKRKVRMEDVIQARLPEVMVGGHDISTPVSVIGGLAGEIYTGGKLVGMARGMMQGGPQTIKSIQNSLDLADEVKNVAGKEITKLFSGQVGNAQITPSLVENIVNSLPKGVFKKIISDPKTYGVEVNLIKDASGKIIGQIPKANAKNVWNIRKALDDLTTSEEFAGKTTSIAKDKLMLASNQFREILSNVDTRVAPIMKKYSDYAETFEDAKRLLTVKGKVVVNKAANALKHTGEPGSQIMLEKYAQLFPKGADMLRDIKRLNRNRAVVGATVFAAKAGVASAIASRFIKPVQNVITGEESKISDGN